MNPVAQDLEADTGPVILDGELTIQHAAQQCQRMRDWLDAGVRQIDLSAVQACDSSGVQLLVAARRSAQTLGQPLNLIGASEPVREVFGRYALLELLAAPSGREDR